MPTDSSELQWVEPDGTCDAANTESRRRQVAALVVAALLAASITPLFSGGVLAATFTASDVSVTSDNGALTAVTVAPNGSVTYDGLENEPNEIQLAVQVNVDGTWETATTKTLSATGLQGSVSYDVSEVDLLSATSLSAGDFMAGADGGDAQTTVDVRVQATFVGVEDGGGDMATTAGDSFTVTVNNQPANGGVGGQANTGATA